MMDVRTLHSEAMDLAETATILRFRGKAKQAAETLRQALKREQQAAMLAISEGAPEPTRSILLRSAAHLARDCGEMRLAEQLVAMGLAGDPPEEIAEELRSIFEEVGFSRHLAVRGVQLQSNDMQLVLAGHAVAPGMAASEEFVSRVDVIQKLVYGTARSERERRGVDASIKHEELADSLRLFVSVPRAASFAVSLRVASRQQIDFPFADSVQIVDLLMERLDMYERRDMSALHEAIPNAERFDRFVDLAEDLSPDGERVRLVGLTSIRDGKERRLEMTKPVEASERAGTPRAPAEPLKLHGRVFFFNAMDEENPIIKLVAEEDGKIWRLKADQQRLDRAVHHAANKVRVLVKGKQSGRSSILVDEFRSVPPRRGKKGPKQSGPKLL